MIFIFEETNSYPLYMGDVQILYPSATEDNLPSGFAIVEETQRPEKEEGKTVYEIAPVKIDGKWLQQWEKRDMTEEELVTYDLTKRVAEEKLASRGIA
jgi:hypothetical protein